jgi:uncharacterized protein DUF2868
MAFSALGRLLDIEWMIESDQARSAADLQRHDRGLLRGQAPSNPEQALRSWLDARRQELDGRTLGVRVSETLTLLHLVLVALSLLAGAGSAEALLQSASAREPTNLLHFLFATLVWPLGLLLGSALAFAVRGRLGRSVLLADVYVRLLGAISRWTRGRAHEDWDLGHEWRKLRRAARRYRDIELLTLASAAQWYPLAFHLGAAASLLGSALFSDLAFAWSTTNDSLRWDTLAQLFRVVSAPWCVPLNEGCVSPELVRATQFSRFDGQYAEPLGAALSGAWWPVLLGCLLVYGVLPRLTFALGLRGLAAHRSRRASERVLELRQRLRAQIEVSASRTHAQPDGAEPAPQVQARSIEASPVARPCWVIRWRGAALEESAEAELCKRLGLSAVRREAAGGSDFSRDSELLQAASQGAEAFVLVVDGWEAPDRATRRFVQGLRQSGAAERPVFIQVLLAAPDAPELSLWRDRLRLLEDPFVVIEALLASSTPARVGSEGPA